MVQAELGLPKRKRMKIVSETDQQHQGPGIILGKNGYAWCRKAPKKTLDPVNLHNNYLPAPNGEARDASKPLDAWGLLISPLILEKIIIHTNEEIHRYRESLQMSNGISESTYVDMELQELKAFIGLMYFSGFQRAAKTNLEDLWSNEYGSTLYRAAMSLKRFTFLARILRFDDKSTRTQRLLLDNLAPIREVWDEFVTNCANYYNPGYLCTVDEQFLNFRGRCSFKIMSPSKPGMWGMKILMLNDARTYYMVTAEPYVGKVSAQQEEPESFYYMQKLSQPIRGTSRNVTCANGFTCMNLCDNFLQDHSLTMVGVLRKNEDRVPENFTTPGTIQSAKFAFDDTKTLLAYTPKKNQVVLMLSTFHHTDEIDEETASPEIVTFYNSTKGGTETFDRMCRSYTTARKTLRWPMRLWMGMLDQAGINAMILYNLNSANRICDRRDFLKNLIMSLVEPHLRARLDIPHLRRDLRLSIQVILKIDVDSQIPKPQGRIKGRGRCLFCPRSRDRKVGVFCDSCHRAVCDDHKTISCLVCYARH